MEPARLHRIYEKLDRFLTDPQDPFLVVSIETQSLLVCRKDAIIERYDASTSRFGNGNRENSLKTPLGIHRIREKFGSGAPAGRVFRDREDTGEDWDHSQTGDNLILTRILRLEGLEEGINKGGSVDSYERYIYIHGTGREDLIGTPLSHGCVCLRNLDVIRLFETVKEGTLVYIDPPAIVISERPCRSVHFTGIFGSGMSALAQYLRFQGITVSGSDRFHASEDTASLRRSLEGLGCAIVHQDGSGVGADTDVVCISTAIEDSNPDIAAARSRGIPIIHRSDLLALDHRHKKDHCRRRHQRQVHGDRNDIRIPDRLRKVALPHKRRGPPQARKAGAHRQCLQRRLGAPGRGSGRKRWNAGQIPARGRGFPECFQRP